MVLQMFLKKQSEPGNSVFNQVKKVLNKNTASFINIGTLGKYIYYHSKEHMGLYEMYQITGLKMNEK